jgi:hypothetical protein
MKVKIKGSTVTVKYAAMKGGHVETRTLESDDPPRTELTRAMDGLLDQAMNTCELPADWLPETTVRQVALSTVEGDDFLQIVLCRVLTSSRITYEIKTPKMKLPVDSEEREAWKLIEKEALQYVDGNRGQLELPIQSAN